MQRTLMIGDDTAHREFAGDDPISGGNRMYRDNAAG